VAPETEQAMRRVVLRTGWDEEKKVKKNYVLDVNYGVYIFSYILILDLFLIIIF
jgi:hypothetical protein